MYKVVCKYSFGHEKCAEELLVDFFSGEELLLSISAVNTQKMAALVLMVKRFGTIFQPL